MYVTGTLLLIPSAPKGRFYRIRIIPRQATGFPDTCRNPVVLVPGAESEFHRRSAVIGINFFSSGSGGLKWAFPAGHGFEQFERVGDRAVVKRDGIVVPALERPHLRPAAVGKLGRKEIVQPAQE